MDKQGRMQLNNQEKKNKSVGQSGLINFTFYCSLELSSEYGCGIMGLK